MRSTSGWFVQTKDGETSLNDGQSIWSMWGSQKSRFCMVLWYPLHLAQSVTEEGWMLRAELPHLSMYLFCGAFTSEVFEQIKFNFFVYHSVFRGGKREFSSIAGVDSPYHSLQVAAVMIRLFHRASLKLLAR